MGDRVEVTVVDDQGERVGSVTATGEHSFWVADLDAWVDAEDLEPGYVFETADHRPAEVGAIRQWTEVHRVHNLTIDGLHTYYVTAADVSILAQNDNLETCPVVSAALD